MEHRTFEEDSVTREDDQSSQCCYESKTVKPRVETWESRVLKKQCLSSDTAGEGASTFGKIIWKVSSVALQGYPKRISYINIATFISNGE